MRYIASFFVLKYKWGDSKALASDFTFHPSANAMGSQNGIPTFMI
jgi:hypothetical protein